MTTDPREIEWQFDASDISIVAAWLKAYPANDPLQVTWKASRKQVDAYLDTEDWRMLRTGYGLRARRSARAGGLEATMKSIAAAVDGLRQRVEINETIDGAEGVDDCALVLNAPGDVGARVRKITGKHPLRALFEVHTSRTAYTLVQNGRVVGEVDLDDTTFPGGDADHAMSLQRVEIETAGGPQDVENLAQFVKHIVRNCALHDAKFSKFEAGLKSRQLKPHQIKGADFGPTKIEESSTVGDLAWAVLRRNFAVMQAHEPGARLGEVAEDIHLMRVAIRRLRAALSLFRDVLPRWLSALRSELGWVAGELGAVRDLDVMIDQIGKWSAHEKGSADAKARLAVAVVLSMTRAEEQDRLLAMLDSDRYEKLITDFSRLLRKPPPGPRWAEATALKAMPDLLTECYRRTRKLGDRLQPDSPAPDYHQLRIRTKRLRYSLEFIIRLYGKPVKATLAGMAELQDTLGSYQDAQSAINRLRAVSGDGQKTLPRETIQAIETVVRRYENHAAACLTHFPKAYQHLKSGKWKRLWKVMRDAR